MTTIVFLMQYFNFETLSLIGHMMHDADAITNLYSLVDISNTLFKNNIDRNKSFSSHKQIKSTEL